jgi:hypothetical protein
LFFDLFFSFLKLYYKRIKEEDLRKDFKNYELNTHELKRKKERRKRKMLKIFALCLITLSIVSATTKTVTVEQIWNQIPRAANGSQCIYIASLMKFTCRSVEVTIDCDAVRHLSGVPTKIFGLSRIPVVKGEVPRFWLYPRVENSTVYLNHTWNFINKTAQSPVDVVLYQGEKFVDFGIRVPEAKCYERIVKFLNGVTSEQVVELESSVVPRPTVNMIGEVLIVDQVMEKRRVGGGLGALGLLALLSIGGAGFGFLG